MMIFHERFENLIQKSSSYTARDIRFCRRMWDDTANSFWIQREIELQKKLLRIIKVCPEVFYGF